MEFSLDTYTPSIGLGVGNGASASSRAGLPAVKPEARKPLKPKPETPNPRPQTPNPKPKSPRQKGARAPEAGAGGAALPGRGLQGFLGIGGSGGGFRLWEFKLGASGLRDNLWRRGVLFQGMPDLGLVLFPKP